MLPVLVLEVRDEGVNVLSSVHSSQERAWAHLAPWVRTAWSEQDHDAEPLPANDSEAVATYFDYWCEEQNYGIAEVVLDPHWAETGPHVRTGRVAPADEVNRERSVSGEG